MNLGEKLTVLVCSCDAYEDLWYPFFKLFNKYWEKCPCRIILNTETKKYEYENLNIECFSFYEDNKVKYGERFLRHMEEIKTPYTLILLDDFFIREKVDENRLREIVSWMEADESIATFNFDAVKDEYNIKSEYDGFVKRSKIAPYKLNMQAGVWRTDYLRKLWRKNDSPWTWEIYGNSRTFDDKYKFYCLQSLNDTPINYGYDENGMGVFRGQWCGDIPPLFETEEISMDFSQRGFYSPEKEQKSIQGNNIFEIVIKALSGFKNKYFIIWFLVAFYKVVCMKLNKPLKYEDYTQFINKVLKKW